VAPPSAVNLQAVQNAAAHLMTVTTSRQSCGSFSGCRFGNAPSSIKLAFLMFKVLNSLVPPYLSDDCQLVSATSRRQLYCLPASKHVCYNVPLHVWLIGLLLLQDSDCGTVSHQNYENLTSPSDNSAVFLLRTAAPCDFVLWHRI